MSTPAAPIPATDTTGPSNLRSVWRRISQGDIGSLPVIAGLILIWAVFDYLNPNFLTPRNLINLVVQISDIGIVAVGIVLVLLLGEESHRTDDGCCQRDPDRPTPVSHNAYTPKVKC